MAMDLYPGPELTAYSPGTTDQFPSITSQLLLPFLKSSWKVLFAVTFLNLLAD